MGQTLQEGFDAEKNAAAGANLHGTELRQQNTTLGTYSFSLYLKDIMLRNGRKTYSFSHRPWSTLLNNKYS